MKLFGGRAKREPSEEGAAPRRRPKRRTVIILSVLLLVAGLGTYGVLAARNAIQPPPIIPASPRTASQAERPGGGGEPEPEPVEGTSPDLVWEGRREGVYTFILAGTEDDYNTDTLMVASLDTVNSKLDVLSIPRDTQVAPRGRVRKINAAWGVGGADELREELKALIGFAPDVYVVINLEGFVELVDNVIGGVEFDVPMKMDDSEAGIHLEAGSQTLNGQQAVQLVRFRHGYKMQDIQRIEMQHEFLFTVFRQTLKLKNVLKIPELASIAQEYMDTDLALGNLIWLGLELLNLQEGDIRFHTLPVDLGKTFGKTDYVLVRKNEALALLNESVNPYLEPLTAEDITVSRVYD